MKPKLKDVLKKAPKDLNSDELEVLHKHWDLLNDEIRTNFKSVAPEEDEDDDKETETTTTTTTTTGDGEDDEELDTKTLDKIISKRTREVIDRKAEEIAKTIAGSIADKVTSARAKFIETGEASKTKNKENDEVTRKFLNAVLSGDRRVLQEMKAIDTTSDSSGSDAGFLIPEPLAIEVMRLAPQTYGVARSLFGYNLLTQGNTKRITSLGAVLSVFWTDEGGKKKSSQPSFAITTMSLKKLAVIVPMTEEVVEDIAIDLTGLVAQLIREAFDKEEDMQFFMGDGTVWDGIFLGGNGDTAIPTVELAANIDATGIRPEDLIALADAVPTSVNGVYLMHRSWLSKIRTLRSNADGTGDYIYNPLANNTSGRFAGFETGTINGKTVVLSEAAPSVADATGTTTPNLPIMMYGDFKVGCAYGEKSDIRFKVLDQATITDTDDTTVINLAEQDMIALRAVKRVGYKVVMPDAMRRLVTGD